MRQNFPKDLRPNVLLTRYPLVFIHGIKSLINFKDYWNGIPEFLYDHGFEVYELKTFWRGPQKIRIKDIRAKIKEILKEHPKVHVIAHSMGTLDTLVLLDDEFVGPHVASATLISPPFDGSPWADHLSFLTPGLHHEVTSKGAEECVQNFKNKYEIFISTVIANPENFKISGLLKIQHFLLAQFLKSKTKDPSNDGLVPLDSQKKALPFSHKNILFPGDHHQVIGAGPWPKNVRTSHEVYLDHSIFLAERDLQASK